MFLTSRMTVADVACSHDVYAAFFTAGEGLGVDDLQRGRHAAAAAVLELHRCLDELFGLAAVQRVDQHLVLLVDGAALDLAGAGHLAVVGVEFLVQHQEAADLAAGQQRVLRQVGIDLLHAFAQAAAAPRALPPGRCSRRKDRLRRSAQLPTASKSMLMKAQTFSRRSPKATASFTKGKNFSLFSTYLGANIAPSLGPPTRRPTSLARSMIFRCPLASREAGVAGVVPAVAGQHLGGWRPGFL